MANSIINAGNQLIIINSGTSDKYFRNSKIYHISLPIRGIYKYIKFYYESKKILIKTNPQKIIAADLFSLPSANSLNDVHIIYDSREIYTCHAGLINKPLTQLCWSFVERLNVQKTKLVLVTADGDVTILKKLYKEITTSCIYNFPSEKMVAKDKNYLRETLNLSTENKIFLYQGALHKGRGIRTMLELLKDFSNFHAVIIGDGPYYEILEHHAKKLNVFTRTHFMGKLPYKKIFQLTIGADIGFALIKPISKSYVQALPNKIFEYAISNIPSLVSDLPEMKKIVKKHSLGFSVPYNDKNKQKEAIKNLLYSNKKNNIQKTALKKLVWEIQEKDFLKALQ